MRIRKVFWFAFGLIAFSLLMTWYSGNYSSFSQSRNFFLRLTVLGSLFIIINWIWTLTSIKKLSLFRNQRLLRLQVGNVFEEGFEVINSLRYSRLWIEIEDMSNLSGISGSKVLSGLGGKKNRYYISRTILTKRGSFNLGPTLLRSGDPFGMFTTEKLVASEAQLLVLPYIETISKFTEPPGFIQGGRAITRKSLEATSFASGVREYQSGDPLNRIHWKSSAKRDKFMVKEFDQDPQADIWIIIDGYEESNSHQIIEEEIQFADTFWALKQKSSFKLSKSTFEYAISISASLASYYIKAEKAVGVACADSVMTVIPTEKGGRQLGKILETMAFFEGKGKMPINEVIESLGYQIIRGSTVVIVSSTDSTNIQLCIEILLRRKLKPVIIQINRETFETSSQDPVSWENNNIPGIIVNYGDSISSCLQSITQYDPSVIRI
jgi:uncharacterized protein (DUF58 family)